MFPAGTTIVIGWFRHSRLAVDFAASQVSFCDVYSGDGMLRKVSAKGWEEWNVKVHMQLHRLQVRLLTRALECVAKGGRVVYSTCSLDPIEDEAVLVTAIARRGGPSAYRIVPIPQPLRKDATAKFSYTPGSTQWIVPHPQFGKHPKDFSTIEEVFESIDQVPAQLRKKDISPSMFPPRVRTEANMRAILKDQDDSGTKLEQAHFYGEILCEEDMARFEEMLPNCGRILPQHLDSGGFFCAIIERLAPSYYPVCYPLLRAGAEDPNVAASADPNIYTYHGRILTNVASAKHMRELVAQDKQPGDEVVFEGVATLEIALEWLKTHRAYQPGVSEQLITVSSENDDEDLELKPFKRAYVNDPNRSPLYTRLLPPPHPSLVAEFCDFFGLLTDPAEAQKVGVEVFPADRLIVVGGGDDAISVESCLDPDQAHTLVQDTDSIPDDTKVHRKRRFAHLTLVSEPIWNLFKGGAKFNPMEVGLGLSWVPIPGLYRDYRPNSVGGGAKESLKADVRFEDPSSRAAQSGRFGLMDEAADYLGRRVTKRLLRLTPPQALELLETSSVLVKEDKANEEIPREGRSRDQPPGLIDIFDWVPGAVIAAVQFSGPSTSEESQLFLPCVLEGQAEARERRIALLSEQKLTGAWQRLLGSK
jgi:16S rRNA methyltransferase RsmB/F